MSIELQHWPHLEDHLKKSVGSNLVASDVMTANPVVVREVERVGTVLDVLLRTTHNAFPVIHTAETLSANPRLGNLAGTHVCVRVLVCVCVCA